ncbi:LysR family transcriptional regulator [Altererythrobacter sp. RZ02]|uniref:LysR family transcriptional regulator n=1 Tax=Pontixanthobacter rizhaonensis TaxID=2730337 RepID=A0A848QUI3_9SPHN|nr:LysR substrate-binding domain-containing protein [Pontixanthobacter rizhaonensis]NMW32758.1 LysR family transcriptional regulator [Pontixanthobacter rizhaonensis]
MNLRDLEYVAAIDRHRNFGRAAKACNVSQPSLSAQVKKLEERLGVELFARTTNGVLTTDAGLRIVETARDMLRSAQRITDTAAEYHDPMAAPLRIGIFPTLAPFVLPYVSQTIKDLAPDLNAIFREQPTDTIWKELEKRTVDVAMMSGPVDRAGYRFSPVFIEPLLLMVSADHRLANEATISVCDVPVEELILLPEEHCLRADTISLCNAKNIGIDVPDLTFATNFLTMSHFVDEGYGSALIPMLARPVLQCANKNMRFIEIEDPSFSREIGFVSRIGCPREHILMALVDQIKAHPPTRKTAAMAG